MPSSLGRTLNSLIWLDALTPKQARLCASIYKELKSEGLDVLVTAREYAETLQVLELEGVPYRRVGKYGGASKVSKLISYAVRAQELVREVEKLGVNVLISLSSPSAVRVAFGLGIPSITLNDTPHAFHVGRLTLPLSTRIISPLAVPKDELIKLGAEEEKIVQYDGVDEVLWVRSCKPDPNVLKNIGVQEKELLVILRPPEEKAAYLSRSHMWKYPDLIRFILKKGAKVVLFPRYPEQRKIAEKIEGLIVPKKALDTLSLYSYSSLVITGGGTMAREASMLGTPSISLFPLDYPLYVNEYLRKKGFPIYRFRKVEEAIPLISEMLENPESYRINTRPILNELESPSEPIKTILDEMDLLS